MTITPNVIFAVAIGTLLVVALVAIAVSVPRKKKQKINLGDLSILWTQDGRAEVHISKLAPLWRNEDADKENHPDADTQFDNPRIRDFFAKQILGTSWFRKSPLQARVATDILLLLDKEGGCKSVVDASGDVESTWDADTYSTLARTTLADHTLNVADEISQMMAAEDAHHIIPDGIIAALGHDLGKLESVRSYMYSLGEHPLAAGRALAEVAEFKDLARKEDILRAIKLHHKKPEGLLGKMLKAADQKARQKELEAFGAEAVAAQKASPKDKVAESQPADTAAEPSRETPVETKLTVEPEQPKPEVKEHQSAASPAQPRPETSKAAWKAQADIFGESGDDKPAKAKAGAGEQPKMVDISSWWDAQAFLNDIKPYINKIFGKRWMAFSMSDGHVYVQAKVLEEIARKHAERAGAMEITTMAPDDPTMRQVLFTIVQHLRVEHQDIIARGLIKDQFFGGYFIITTKQGREWKGFYTPFHAEAFGAIAEMEAAKPGFLKTFQSVKPVG